LPRLLSLLPKDGVASSVYQSRWATKGLPVPSPSAPEQGCRWEVKKVALDLHGNVTGRAWGVQYWKGKRVTPAEKEYELISGGLKYNWAAAITPPLLAQEAQARLKAAQPQAAEGAEA
ncbi:hypothetical protein BCR35DRAFT_252535, partial [Leucosporidium creatinivorum]